MLQDVASPDLPYVLEQNQFEQQHLQDIDFSDDIQDHNQYLAAQKASQNSYIPFGTDFQQMQRRIPLSQLIQSGQEEVRATQENSQEAQLSQDHGQKDKDQQGIEKGSVPVEMVCVRLKSLSSQYFSKDFKNALQELNKECSNGVIHFFQQKLVESENHLIAIPLIIDTLYVSYQAMQDAGCHVDQAQSLAKELILVCQKYEDLSFCMWKAQVILTLCLIRKEKYSQAFEVCSETVKSQEKFQGSLNPNLMQVWNNLAVIMYNLDEYRSSGMVATHALKVGSKVKNSYLAQTYQILASVAYKQGSQWAAECFIRQAVDILECQVGKEHSWVLYCVQILIMILEQQIVDVLDSNDVKNTILQLRKQYWGQTHISVAFQLSKIIASKVSSVQKLFEGQEQTNYRSDQQLSQTISDASTLGTPPQFINKTQHQPSDGSPQTHQKFQALTTLQESFNEASQMLSIYDKNKQSLDHPTKILVQKLIQILNKGGYKLQSRKLIEASNKVSKQTVGRRPSNYNNASANLNGVGDFLRGPKRERASVQQTIADEIDLFLSNKKIKDQGSNSFSTKEDIQSPYQQAAYLNRSQVHRGSIQQMMPPLQHQEPKENEQGTVDEGRKFKSLIDPNAQFMARKCSPNKSQQSTQENIDNILSEDLQHIPENCVSDIIEAEKKLKVIQKQSFQEHKVQQKVERMKEFRGQDEELELKQRIETLFSTNPQFINELAYQLSKVKPQPQQIQGQAQESYKGTDMSNNFQQEGDVRSELDDSQSLKVLQAVETQKGKRSQRRHSQHRRKILQNN